MFRPIWNVKLDGFGNHDPGANRRNSKRSKWDVIHPGRAWAKLLTGVVPSQEELIAELLTDKPTKQNRKKSSE